MGRVRAVVPWLVAAVSALAVVAAVPLAAVNRAELGIGSVYVVNALVGAVVPFAGALLVSRRPANPVGWVLLSAAGLGVSFLGLSWADYAESSRPGALPGAGWAALVGGVVWVPFLALVTLLPLWFPDGRPAGRTWTVVERGVIVLLAVLAALCAVEPRVADGRADNPLVAGPAWTATAIDTVSALVVASAVLLCLPAAVLRYLHADRDGRIRLRWFLSGVVLVAGALVVPAPAPLSDVLTGSSICLLAVAITASVLRHGLYGIEIVVDRTLVYGTLAVLLVTLYLCVVALVGLLLPSWAAVTGTAVVALALAPVHARLRSMARRLLYGDRDDPYAALTRLAARVEHNLDPDDVPGVALREVRVALRLARAELRHDGQVLAAAGDDVPGATGEPPVALVHQGAVVGELRVTPRPGGYLGPRDRALLADLARALATVVHAATLRADLARARGELVEALEQERRRLRADLHDGIGPALAAHVLALDAAAHAARGPDPGTAVTALVQEMKEGVRDTVAELRRLVDELRPPALDELGLAGALERHVATFRHACPRIRVECASELTGLPAAVEVAAYRIASEAVANVVRHAGAASCAVRLTTAAEPAADPAADRAAPGILVLEVRDDGVGRVDGSPDGAGLASMRDRARALGGTLEISDVVPSGTLVRASLPVRSG